MKVILRIFLYLNFFKLYFNLFTFNSFRGPDLTLEN